MQFYPILQAPGCLGKTTLYNFPPNNWEYYPRCTQIVNLLWIANGAWHSVMIDELSYGSMRRYDHSDFSAFIEQDVFCLLCLTNSPLPRSSQLLPDIIQTTTTPTWRATLELSTTTSSTSYQGELSPFPAPGSLLTFSPLIQVDESVHNYLLLLNLEKSPMRRGALVQLYKLSNSFSLLDSFYVYNNAISAYKLDPLRFSSIDLPAIICKNMSFIPLFLSVSLDGSALSLEHTHPPASYVIHGRRRDAQKYLKNRWFSK